MSERVCGSALIAAFTVNGNEPAVVGAPEITPSDAPIANPAGSAPATIENVFVRE